MWSLLELWRRIRMLVGCGGFDGDIDEEMRLHVELRAARFREEGLPTEAAEDTARRRFGNSLRLKEESREAWGWAWLYELWSDVHYGWRTLRRTPVMSAATVVVLGVAAGVNTAIFATVHGVLLAPLPFPDGDRLVRIYEHHPRRGVERVAPRNYLDWRAQTHAFDDMAFVVAWRHADRFTLIDQGSADRLQGAVVQSNFFRMLAPRPLMGRYFSIEEDTQGAPPAVVLSERLWRRRFGGDEHVLGRVVTLERGDRASFTVVGVVPATFDHPAGTELWIPAGVIGEGTLTHRNAPWFDVVGRLKTGVRIDDARAELERVQQRIAAEAGDLDVSPSVAVTPLIEDMVESVRPMLILLQASALVVLLLACANVANLLLAAASGRYREIAVRSALGATTRRLLRLVSIESLMRAAFATVLGTLLAAGALTLFRASAWVPIPRLSTIELNAPVLFVALVGAFCTAFLIGVAPGLNVVRSGRMDRLRETGRSVSAGRDTTRARRALTVAQVALTLMLLVTAGLLLQSLYRLQRVELGFLADGLAAAEFDFSGAVYSTSAAPGPHRPQDVTRRILEQMEALPGVRAAAADLLPTQGGIPGEIAIDMPSTRPAIKATAFVRAVTPSYFDVLGIPFLEGRPLENADTEATPPVVLINETMAKRYYGERSPVGRRLDLHVGFRADDPILWYEIVGVVGDVRNGGVHRDPQPEVFSPYYQWAWNETFLFLRTDSPLSIQSAALTAAVTGLSPEQPPVTLLPMTQILAADHADARFRTSLVVAFGLIAILLAAVGTFAMVDFGVAQRTNELGLRLALGAGRIEVCHLVAGDTLRLVAVGTAIGLAGAVVVGQLIRPLLFEVSGHDAPTFAAATITIYVVVCAAMSLPLRRVVRIAPQDTLRHGDG